jgi:hypothetical protein
MAGMFRRNEADPTLYLFVGGNELGTALPLLERAVREQLSSPDPRRRRQCAEALSWFPAVSERTFAELDRRLGVEEDSEVVDPILSNFEHRSRAPSRKSLVHAGGFAGHKGVRSVCNLLRLFRDEQPHLLCELCNSGNGEMLAAAAERIPEFGPRCVGATPGLARQLTDDTYLFYRSWLCQALEEIGPGARDSLPALEHVLKTDANSPARMYACRAMASIGRDDPQSIAGTLGEALADEERLVRIEAAKGLSMLGAGALPARNKLRAAAKDPDREFRQWVAKSLEAIEPKQP